MLDSRWNEQIQLRIDNKTKPLGALGCMETVAFQLAQIQSQRQQRFVTQIQIDQPHLLLFAADHGIAAQGVSIAPSAVTQQMVANFLAGGAAINGFCRVSHIPMTVVDCGMLSPVAASLLQTDDSASIGTHYIEQRLGAGTQDFSAQAAMGEVALEQGLDWGAKLANTRIDQGVNILMFGEMGIGNTSSASALLALMTQTPLEVCVGRGTGIDEQQYQRKCALISAALARVSAAYAEPLSPQQALMEVGGYEIVQMVGAMLAAGERRIPMLIDGFIASVAALIAVKIEPSTRDVMLFAHQSAEAGHRTILQALDGEPLLQLGMRLGEGTGAALAYPLLRCASEFYNNMASFESAGVTV